MRTLIGSPKGRRDRTKNHDYFYDSIRGRAVECVENQWLRDFLDIAERNVAYKILASAIKKINDHPAIECLPAPNNKIMKLILFFIVCVSRARLLLWG